MESGLTHFDENGKALMVDVTDKGETVREATAAGKSMVSRADSDVSYSSNHELQSDV